MREKIIIVDGNSLVYKAFFALPPMQIGGVFTNAVFGFCNMLIKTIKEQNPNYMVVAFDVSKDTFRKGIYKDYKANRKETPPDLVGQFKLVKEILKSTGITVLEKEGYEADDIVGTLTYLLANGDLEKVVISGDRDVFSLVGDNTVVHYSKRGTSDLLVVDKDTLKKLYGLTPESVTVFKALKGDSSDNIPGVAGVGDKTALELVTKYGTLDNIYANLDDFKGALRARLENGKESAYTSLKLATINTFVYDKVSLADFKFSFPFKTETKQIFERLGFNSLIKRAEIFEVAGAGQTNTAVGSSKTKKADALQNNTHTNNQPATQSNIQTRASDKALKRLEGLGQIEALIEKIKSAGQMSFVIANDVHIATNETTEYIIPLQQNLLDMGLALDSVLGLFKPLLENAKIAKPIFDKKSTAHFLDKFSITLRGVSNCLLIENYLFDVNTNVKTYAQLLSKYSATLGDTDKYLATNIFALKNMFAKEFDTKENANLKSLYRQIEFPLISVLYDMEKAGIKIDTDYLEVLEKKYVSETAVLTNQIYESVNEKFNINSTKQLGAILFDKLKLRVVRKTKTGYSTDAETLKSLEGKHEVIALLIRYRAVTKLLSTYIEGLKGHIDVKSGKVHTNFQQALTTTGRLSSEKPNVQNLPIKTDEGKEIRKVFVPSSANHTLVLADYSQIELRLLAHYSKDEKLIDAFKKGEDIHTATAAAIYGIPKELVNSNMRRGAKAVNFGIIYGMGDFGLAKELNVPRARAAEFINKYFEAYPSIKEYMDASIAEARLSGYAVTLFGRRRHILELMSANFNVRSFGERAAMNMPLQGSAADIIKKAMVKVHDRFLKQNLKSRLILQIHDELVVDACKTELDKVKEILRLEMESVIKLEVPLKVDVEVSDSL
ncbi:MAG: DNA polymerase I [Firmicutes bacterium]|nr:DNA polymerase I [Bacillota bacterium]